MEVTNVTQTEPGGTITVEGKLASGWSVKLRLIVRGQRYEIAELHVFPARGARQDRWSGRRDHVPHGGLPVSRLHDVQTGDLEETIQEWLGEPGGEWTPPEHLIGHYWTLAQRAKDRPPAERLAPLAAAYVTLLDAGTPNPNAILAEYWGRSVTHELYRARNIYDLLTDAPAKGKPGGRLTAKGQEVLAALEEEETS
jgi:hypothetical protein